jgi:hypothetical protein
MLILRVAVAGQGTFMLVTNQPCHHLQYPNSFPWCLPCNGISVVVHKDCAYEQTYGDCKTAFNGFSLFSAFEKCLYVFRGQAM